MADIGTFRGYFARVLSATPFLRFFRASATANASATDKGNHGPGIGISC
jgi:hypothetical protein